MFCPNYRKEKSNNKYMCEYCKKNIINNVDNENYYNQEKIMYQYIISRNKYDYFSKHLSHKNSIILCDIPNKVRVCNIVRANYKAWYNRHFTKHFVFCTV